MFAGYSTLGAVALRIMEDYGPVVNKHGRMFNMAKTHTRYDLPHLLWKVCEARESVATASHQRPSYIWWTMGLSEYSEIEPIPDLGRLPKLVRRASKRGHNYHNHRFNWPKEHNESDGAWSTCLKEEVRSYSTGEGMGPQSPLYLMMVYGLSFGQRILTRCVGDTFQTSYECDEWDSSWSAEIIYAEPTRVIDIPFDFPNFAEKPRFCGWRLA